MEKQSYNYFFICDHASVNQYAQLEIRNIFNQITSGGVPARKDCMYALGFKTTQPDNFVEIYISDSTGKTIYTFCHQYSNTPVGKIATFIGQMNGIMLEEFGSYLINVVVNGAQFPEENEYTFELVKGNLPTGAILTNEWFRNLFNNHFKNHEK